MRLAAGAAGPLSSFLFFPSLWTSLGFPSRLISNSVPQLSHLKARQSAEMGWKAPDTSPELQRQLVGKGEKIRKRGDLMINSIQNGNKTKS